MTHFIGAVLVPASIGASVTVTEEPYRYASPNSPETEFIAHPNEALQKYLHEALDRFDENKSVDLWVSYEDTIKNFRDEVKDKAESETHREFLALGEKAYREKYPTANENHYEYHSKEIPRLELLSDMGVFEEATKYAEAGDIRKSDRAVHHTYNPDSKWDWWTIGGRWGTLYKERQGEKIGALREQLSASIAAKSDPIEAAKLAAVEEEIEQAQNTFRKQNEEIRAIKAESDGKLELTFDEALAKWKSKNSEARVDWDTIDAITAKRGECAAYTPWWTPYSLVVPPAEGVDEAQFEWLTKGRMGWFGMSDDRLSDTEWLEKLIEIIDSHDPESLLVYIDFHI